MGVLPAKQLLTIGDQVTGVVVASPEGDISIRAEKGVVLAAGGFPWDVSRRKMLFPKTPTGEDHWPLPPSSASGDGLRLGESVGGVVDTSLYSPSPGHRSRWFPIGTAMWATFHILLIARSQA